MYQAYKNINPRRVQNTCNWFLHHPKFEAWQRNDSPDILWLAAHPGCGKSVLARSLIDERILSGSSVTVCYFFFKDNEEQNSIATAMCALIHQLFCAQNGLLQTHGERFIAEHGQTLKDDFEALWHLWISASCDASSGDVICLIDALDECQPTDSERLIDKLDEFYENSQAHPEARSKLKFFITSRPDGDIERSFGKITSKHPNIRLAAEDEWKAIRDEIYMVIDAKIDEIGKIRRFSAKVQEALKLRLSSTGDTNYLWLHLVLDAIKRCTGNTEKKLLRQINDLPKSVEDAYEKILVKCHASNIQDTRQLLEVIVAASRPLSLAEIDIALEVEVGSQSLSDLDLQDEEREQWIRDVCGLFVSVVDARVYLIHQTAREFLLCRADEAPVPGIWRHSIYLNMAHSTISKACIGLLNVEEMRSIKSWKSGYWDFEEAPIATTDFVGYSAGYWRFHMRKAAPMGGHWIGMAAELCQDHQGHYPPWLSLSEARNIERWDSNSDSTSRAANWGLLQVLKFLSDRSEAEGRGIDEAPLSVRGLRRESTLSEESLEECPRKPSLQEIGYTEDVFSAAARNSNNGETVMEHLLNTSNFRITEQVVKAAAENWAPGEAVMKLLLDRRGSEFTITEEVVQAAAENWCRGDALMKLLLDRRGSEFTITEELVKAAAENWSRGEALMELLLDRRGSEFKITEEVVQAAAVNDSSGEAIIKLLLDRRGLEFKITDRVAQAAAANLSCGEAVLNLLLDRRGSEFTITEEVVQDAAANWSSGEAVMKLLLDKRGSEFKITDKVAQAAAENLSCGEAVMKLLVDRRGSEFKLTDQVVEEAI